MAGFSAEAAEDAQRIHRRMTKNGISHVIVAFDPRRPLLSLGVLGAKAFPNPSPVPRPAKAFVLEH